WLQPNHGTYAGGLTFGGAAGVTFNGTSGRVSSPDNATVDLGDPTGAADVWGIWVRMKRGATGAIRSLVSKGDKSYGLQLDATGRPQIVSNGVVIATASSAIADTNVHDILACRVQGGAVAQI